MDCANHKSVPSTHIAVGNRTPLCDECTEKLRENGVVVRRHRGFLWGYPIVVEDDDGILETGLVEEEI